MKKVYNICLKGVSSGIPSYMDDFSLFGDISTKFLVYFSYLKTTIAKSW